MEKLWLLNDMPEKKIWRDFEKVDLDLFYRTNPAQGPTRIELEKNTTFRLRFHLHRAPTREFQ